MKYKAVIFDLDGTLLNSLPDIANTVNTILEQYNLPTHSHQAIEQMVGNGFTILLQRAVPEKVKNDNDLFRKIEIDARAFYQNNSCTDSCIYPGFEEVLDQLMAQGISLNINTNKPHSLVEPILNHYLSRWKFDVVIGQRTDRSIKPDPEAALEISQTLNIRPNEILFVGDSSVDIQTAANAKMDSLGVTWGFSSKSEIEDSKPTHLIDSVPDITKIVLNQ